MKKADIIKLRLKGVSTEDIQKLMELETLAEDADEVEEAPAPDPDPEPEPEPEPREDPIQKALEEAQAEIEKLRAEKEAAQKAAIRRDISGADNVEDDQDIFNNAIRSLM